MTGQTARRFAHIQESATFAVSELVRRLQASGVQVSDLGGGDPDFPTPQHIVEAAECAMREGFTHYVDSRGTRPLRQAIADKLERDNGLSYDPDREIIITPSAKHAVYIALLTILDPDDEIIIFTPSWVSYEAMAHLVGAKPVLVRLEADDGFVITPDHLRAHLTPRTRALLVNTPNNPTGRMLTAAEAQVINDVAAERDLLVVSDEIYEKITYDGRRHVSLAALPGAFDRTLTINGFSKAYAMTGWRLGYLAGPAQILAEAIKAQQHTVGCAASFVQTAAVAALQGPQSVVDEMVDEYAARRRLIVDGLNALPGVRCAEPDGAFYAFANVEGAGLGASVAFSRWLIEEARVAVTAGSAFGPGGEGHVRLSFANSRDVISEAIERMRVALERRAATAG